MAFLDYCSNPKELMKLIPCWACLTPQQLRAAKVRLMCDILNGTRGTTCNIDTLQADSACYACLSETQMEQLEIAGLCAVAVVLGTRDSCTDVEKLVDDIKCLACLPPLQLRGMFDNLFCQWLATQAAAAQD